MTHKPRKICLASLIFLPGDMAIHVNHREKVETQRVRQTTQQQTTKHQTVRVRLVVPGKVVEVEEFHFEHCVVRTCTHIRDCETRHHFDGEKHMVHLRHVNEKRQYGQCGVRTEERHLKKESMKDFICGLYYDDKVFLAHLANFQMIF